MSTPYFSHLEAFTYGGSARATCQSTRRSVRYAKLRGTPAAGRRTPPTPACLRECCRDRRTNRRRSARPGHERCGSGVRGRRTCGNRACRLTVGHPPPVATLCADLSPVEHQYSHSAIPATNFQHSANQQSCNSPEGWHNAHPDDHRSDRREGPSRPGRRTSGHLVILHASRTCTP